MVISNGETKNIGVALHYGQEAFACAGFGNANTCSFHNGRHDVLNTNGAFASNFLRIPPLLWATSYERGCGHLAFHDQK